MQRAGGHVHAMNTLSLLLGIVAASIAAIGFLPIPLLPLVNWVAFPIALLGVLIGLSGRRKSGRNLNLLVLLVSGVRLFLTAGLIRRTLKPAPSRCGGTSRRSNRRACAWRQA